MSRLVLNTNIAAMTAQRGLSSATDKLSESFTRLSSGLRINRASDDPAGLAVSKTLETEKRIFNQGVRNLNDGISLLSIADGALTELNNISTRILELAQQSANGTLSNTQRIALDDEAQALKKEFTRISQTTEFNDKKLFDGSFGDLRLQAGFGESGGITSGLGGAIGDGTFGTASSFGTGDSPVSVSIRDFNGDGILDLVTADQSDNTVSILQGNGDGTFGAATSFSVGTTPTSVSSGDFNGDGMLDLVTSNFDDNQVSVLLGNGDGTFGAATSFNVGDSPRTVLSGDFNGNGVLDLVTADQAGSTVSILQGNGDGTFGAATSYGVGNLPFSVISEDLNGDGVLDIVTADAVSGTVSVLLGNGDGTFGATTSFSVGNDPRSVSTGDFNGDGVLDLVTADYGGNAVSILQGHGDGTFGPATSFSVGNFPRSVSTGDFNGDGKTDLVTADYFGNTASVLLGNGDGTFETASNYGVGNAPRSVSTGDLNGDGVPDLITTDRASDTVSVLLGNFNDGVHPILDFSLKTKTNSLEAIDILQNKLELLSLQRGKIGAFESRVNFMKSLTEMKELNLGSAASQITDVDVASESSELVRNQILQQSAVFTLAQANLQPQLALSLLSDA